MLTYPIGNKLWSEDLFYAFMSTKNQRNKETKKQRSLNMYLKFKGYIMKPVASEISMLCSVLFFPSFSLMQRQLIQNKQWNIDQFDQLFLFILVTIL